MFLLPPSDQKYMNSPLISQLDTLFSKTNNKTNTQKNKVYDWTLQLKEKYCLIVQLLHGFISWTCFCRFRLKQSWAWVQGPDYSKETVAMERIQSDVLFFIFIFIFCDTMKISTIHADKLYVLYPLSEIWRMYKITWNMFKDYSVDLLQVQSWCHRYGAVWELNTATCWSKEMIKCKFSISHFPNKHFIQLFCKSHDGKMDDFLLLHWIW